jgi:hypothetical protein
VESAKKSVEGAGDIWTWTALYTDTKLVPSWLVLVTRAYPMEEIAVLMDANYTPKPRGPYKKRNSN